MGGALTAAEQGVARVRRHRAVDFARAVVRRYWDADGASHSRALAYHSMLVLLAGFIGFLGLVSVLDSAGLRRTAEEMVTGLSPGPSGRILREAAQRGASGGPTGMILGFAAALAAGTRGMRQVERAANRTFGVEEDRSFLRRYGVAFGLAASAGTLLTMGALAIAGGEAIATGAAFTGGAETFWTLARWPIGVVSVAAALYLVYRVAPRERPGTPRDLAMGVATALTLWVMFTGLLVLYFSLSDKALQTYGPLVGVVALLLWSALTSLATILGLSVIAELAERGDASKRSA